MGILSYDSNNFLMDGKPYRIIAGAIHYFRVPEEYWTDRLLKLKECGFNTVETYTAWNLHEMREGEFNFEGMLNIEKFVAVAESLGLNVIVRPGPYICSEWEFGGFPAWLHRYPGMELRCSDPVYLEKVGNYLRKLLPRLVPHLSTNGGGIIMMQIENEYGSYGDDSDYLRAIADIYRECGVDCLLFTSDGAAELTLKGGTLPEHLAVVNFGSNPKSNFATLRAFRPDQPMMCGEFWGGWFDHWYESHHTRDAKEVAGEIKRLLEMGASFCLYMFHGGTNFGYMNGANCPDGNYQPTVTSYDSHAPVTEAGDLAPVYFEYRRVIEEFLGEKLPPLTVGNLPKCAYGKVKLTESARLLDVIDDISSPVHTVAPKYIEDIGQAYGYTLYSSVLTGPIEPVPLAFNELRDRATVFLDGKYAGKFERSRFADSVKVNLGKGESVRIDILCENMGRVNYGPEIVDRKGIRGVRLGAQHHYGWDMYPIEDIGAFENIKYSPCRGGAEPCTFMRGKFTVKGKPEDTFIKLKDFHRGTVIVNGFNLGRYYNDAGPQKTLYCPAPMLREGENTVVVFETDGSRSNMIELVKKPELG